VTTCQTTFSLSPLPQTVPERVTLRKIFPVEIPADRSQSSIREIDHLQPRAPLIFVVVEKVVIANSEVKQMPRGNAGRVMIVVFCASGGNVQKS
jgi:hypothetical protein